MWSLSSLRKLNSSSLIGVNGGFKCISYVPSRFSSSYGSGDGDNEMERNSKPQDNMENMNSQDNLTGPTENSSARKFLQGTIDSLRLVGENKQMGRNSNPQGNSWGRTTNMSSQDNFQRPMTNISSQYNFPGSRGNMNSQDNYRRQMTNVGSRDILGETVKSVLSSGPRNYDMRRNSRPMDYVRGVIEQDQFAQYSMKQDAHFVLMQLGRNNTHINVTDANGATKFWTASGNKNVGGGAKVTRYAAEATAEFVGRRVREMGVKSVVVRVKGFTYFKKKRQAIMSFQEGFSSSRRDSPIKYIEDVTRSPHNGCRLPKKRRI
ncbi:small ribosomal subunit protein uS11m-like [Euphorbia lathyris]|uniref:small ribosomal subunit protein uS11m-like n=1 Tax=Euphorbia lathyris TaxID=212925 RepID=UPI0033144666